MDIFTVSRSTYTVGDIVKGIDSTLWIERYNKPGEFVITGDPLMLRENLPVGSFISHPDTNQIMIVENHLIDETVLSKGPLKLVASGRDVAAYIMDNRVVSLNRVTAGTWTTAMTYTSARTDYASLWPMEYRLASGYSWEHVYELLDRFLYNSDIANENLPNFSVLNLLYDDELYPKLRTVKRLSKLSKAVYEILQSADIGLQIERPNSSHSDLRFIIHAGNDLSDTIQFGRSAKDLVSGKYLWSNKDVKDAFYASLTGMSIRSFDGTGWDARVQPVDVDDWAPDTLVITDPVEIAKAISARGVDAIRSSPPVGLIEATAKRIAGFSYGADYRIGDIVYVVGNYEASAKLRLVEHAATSDQTGENSVHSFAPIATQIY